MWYLLRRDIRKGKAVFSKEFMFKFDFIMFSYAHFTKRDRRILKVVITSLV